MTFIEELTERGLIKDCTNVDVLKNLTSRSGTKFYIGFDCTAPSLHVGSLIQLKIIELGIAHDLHPVVMLASSTTAIGDPTGKSKTRPVLSDNIISDNRNSLKKFIEHCFGDDVTIIDNSWHNEISFLDMTRNFLSNVSVNEILNADTMGKRLEANEHISLSELLYSSMQAYDFFQMSSLHDCHIQFGGSDQWFNILQGKKLCEKNGFDGVVGVTTPLLLDSNGEKFGKSVGKPVWLDEDLTSNSEYWNFWRNIEDEDVIKLSNMFTDIDILTISVEHRQSHLANEMTLALRGSINTTIKLPPDVTLLDAIKATDPSLSMKQCRRLIEGNAVRINGLKCTSPNSTLNFNCILSVGKKDYDILMMKGTK